MKAYTNCNSINLILYRIILLFAVQPCLSEPLITRTILTKGHFSNFFLIHSLKLPLLNSTQQYNIIVWHHSKSVHTIEFVTTFTFQNKENQF